MCPQCLLHIPALQTFTCTFPLGSITDIPTKNHTKEGRHGKFQVDLRPLTFLSQVAQNHTSFYRPEQPKIKREWPQILRYWRSRLVLAPGHRLGSDGGNIQRKSPRCAAKICLLSLGWGSDHSKHNYNFLIPSAILPSFCMCRGSQIAQ